MNGVKSFLLISIIVSSLVLSSGCIFGGGGKPKKKTYTYVTPCDVINTGIQLRIVGDLNAASIRKEIPGKFVDDLTAMWAATSLSSLTLNCYWGKKEGQRRDYYYCETEYSIPDIGADGTIKRTIRKAAVIGFKVEEHSVGAWTDLAGEEHVEETYYYLTVKSEKTLCWIV